MEFCGFFQSKFGKINEEKNIVQRNKIRLFSFSRYIKIFGDIPKNEIEMKYVKFQKLPVQN